MTPARSALRAAPLLLSAVVLAGCTAAGSAPADPGAPGAPSAERVVQATEVHEATGLTLLEGPTFGPDGLLYVVDVAAPPGDAKVLSVDVDSGEVETVYTDDAGAYSSAQFSPRDGRLYLTDFRGGRIVSIAADGSDPVTFFAGDVDGRPMQPDDLAFDEDGDLYVSDSTGYDGTPWDPQGRVVRIDGATAQATVLADGLGAPNGIAFDVGFTGLWVGEYTDNRVDHLALTPDGTAVDRAHEAIRFDGGVSQIDSIAVDADGNLYQAVHGQPAIHVFSPTGDPLATIAVPDGDAAGLDSATNVAIRPGTTEAYMTVSGPDGGFVYSFEALAEGVRQSNGG